MITARTPIKTEKIYRLNIYCFPETKKILDFFLKRDGAPKNEIIRRALREYFKKHS